VTEVSENRDTTIGEPAGEKRLAAWMDTQTHRRKSVSTTLNQLAIPVAFG
jgi:hypothetical protein